MASSVSYIPTKFTRRGANMETVWGNMRGTIQDARRDTVSCKGLLFDRLAAGDAPAFPNATTLNSQ